jgi:hypothetical protein
MLGIERHSIALAMALSVSSVSGSLVPQVGRSTGAAGRADTARPASSQQADPKQLTPDEQRKVAELQKIDKAVHAHEAAHLAAAGGLAVSGASYSYVYGPDGKRYAVGGEVSIDTSAESRAQANIDKGRRVRAAAMAPADPSPQDRAVASAGDQLVTLGRAELAAEQRQQQADDTQAHSASHKVARSYGTAGTTAKGNSISLYA